MIESLTYCFLGGTLSYDVNKDGVKVAVLTFTKSAYRLGETVMGVIELNRRAGRSRVLKVNRAAFHFAQTRTDSVW